MCAVWLDRFNRKIQIDWDRQRFVYQCAEADRPAAFTPRKSYPLALLFAEDSEAIAANGYDFQPASADQYVESARRWCLTCKASTSQDRLSEESWMCQECGKVFAEKTATKTVAAAKEPRRKKSAELKQLSLF
jgi:ribosomal protein L37AE/L43A